MCGICGELRFDTIPVQTNTLHNMLKVLAPRGPDDTGLWLKDNIGLGHQRLAIIDLSKQGHQPMYDATLGLTLVFNGTIYNYLQLRDDLIKKGYFFFSHSDTEVILKAYHAWGEQCLSRLEGMFAFAIWDNSRLFIARDRFGIKPLYYAQTQYGFRFASTLPALLATDNIDTNIDPIGLHHQFTLHAVIPAPYTILKGVRKVPPAHFMTITQDAKVNTQRYWQLQAQRPQKNLSDNQWVEAIHEALKAAVASHRSIADVPVGVLLSGGLDSSLLVGLLAENNDVENLFTFSIGFDDIADEKGSEFEYSDQVVARYRTRHQKLHIPNGQVLTRLPEAITHMSEPMVGQDAVAFYLLAEQVSQQVKVVQSGQGADEVFAGYFWYALMDTATGSDLKRFASYYFDRSHDEFLQTVTPDYHGADYTSSLITELLAFDGATEFLDKVLRMDVTTLIVDDPVKRVDNMTMAWGLEARVPFLDHKLVELAAQIPPKLKLQESGKYPLKAIARNLLPTSVIDRPKGYFPMPALKYVRGEFLHFMQAILNSDSCRQRGLFQRDYVNKLLDQPERYMTKLNGSKLWHLALLETWLQEHVG